MTQLPKKTLSTVLVVSLSLAALGITAQASPAGTGATPSPTATPAKEETSSSSSSSDNKKMGEEFKVGDFSYKIVRVLAIRGLKRSYQKPLRAAEGAAFIVVDYVVRNDGAESQNVWSSGFKIADAHGREFATSSEIETAMEMESRDRDDMFVKQLHPGIARKLRAGFEVPKEILNQPIVLVIPEKGILSTGTAEVDLVVTKYTGKKAEKKKSR